MEISRVQRTHAFLAVACALSLVSCSLFQKSTRLHFASGRAQLEIHSTDGTRILVDVSDRKRLSSPPKDTDILLTTHVHGDHYIPEFVKEFKGQKLTFQGGKIDQGQVHITGLVSSHGEQYDPNATNPSNIIFMIDVDSLRIVHFGDIGQTVLTPEQIQTLGKVDIAVTQFGNDFAAMNLSNRKGFNLMDQVRPGVIIPTHMDIETYEFALKKFTSYWFEDGFISIRKKEIPENTVLFSFGDVGKFIGSKQNYRFAKW